MAENTSDLIAHVAQWLKRKPCERFLLFDFDDEVAPRVELRYEDTSGDECNAEASAPTFERALLGAIARLPAEYLPPVTGSVTARRDAWLEAAEDFGIGPERICEHDFVPSERRHHVRLTYRVGSPPSQTSVQGWGATYVDALTRAFESFDRGEGGV